MRHGARVRRLALWVVLPGVVLLAAILWVRSRPPSSATHLGESWYLGGGPIAIIEAGVRFRSLYRKTGRRFVRVDRMIARARFYQPDCVVYSAAKEFAEPIVVVCGNRTPVRIMDWGRDWLFEAEGLVLQRRFRAPGGTSIRVETVEIKPIQAIMVLARSQPAYAADWQERDSAVAHDRVESMIPEPRQDDPDIR